MLIGLLLCPCCSDFYNDPRLLPCCHSVCFSCISKAEGSTFTCPECNFILRNSRHAAADLPRNIQLDRFVENWKQNQEKVAAKAAKATVEAEIQRLASTLLQDMSSIGLDPSPGVKCEASNNIDEGLALLQQVREKLIRKETVSEQSNNVSTFQQDLIDLRLAYKKLEEEVGEKRELIRNLLLRLRTTSMECIVLLRQLSEHVVKKDTVCEESKGETVAKRLRRRVSNKND